MTLGKILLEGKDETEMAKGLASILGMSSRASDSIIAFAEKNGVKVIDMTMAGGYGVEKGDLMALILGDYEPNNKSAEYKKMLKGVISKIKAKKTTKKKF